MLAGFLRERTCEMVRCRTVPLDVPADAEIILEGYVDPTAPRVPTPKRGTLTGHYSLPSEAVVMQVTAVTHRANPIQVAIQPARPPHELSSIRGAMLDCLKPLLLAAVPDIVDFHFPSAAGCRHAAIVSIRKTRPHQARQAAGALWALEPWMFARLLVIVDEETNVADPSEVLSRVVTNADLARDVFPQTGSSDSCHHASPHPSSATLLGIDATRKLPAEHTHPWPAAATMSQDIAESVTQRWVEYGLG
jgi:4-hydroxy-3-polyprenylbenzoate decarboxylase